MQALDAQIKIDVQTEYIHHQSEPQKNKYLFTYTITIKNTGSIATKLQRRRWVITDANGQKQEMEGEGVIGETPTIEPNDSYQYTSGTVLNTPVGMMEGSYQMLTSEGQHFTAKIPVFSLAVPGSLH